MTGRADHISGVILNAYPDSIGTKLSDIVSILKCDEFQDTFQSFYILPSVFNSDLDRGFSIIDYSLNETLASVQDLSDLRELGIDLIMDLVLNHISVLSPQFQDILKKGNQSQYKDFFINWNKFWEGCGIMTEAGYIQPDKKYLRNMFFRKEGLPILMVRFPDGSDVPYWNTFYQSVSFTAPGTVDLVRDLGIQYSVAAELSRQIEKGLREGKKPEEISFSPWEKYADSVIRYLESKRTYLGQMDLNISSDQVIAYYEDTLRKLAAYGVTIVRLDAFAYAPKSPGKHNFLNTPDTWNFLHKIDHIATPLGLALLPEIHASYAEKTYSVLASKGYQVYDFFLPGLIIDAFERKNGVYIAQWGEEIVRNNIHTVNMLGCHDGIPLLDLKGLLPEADIQHIIDVVVARGGFVKDLHGAKNVYYQVNATYYSALGEKDSRMLLARAVQLFMPGKPQVWYLDLFGGENDYKAMKKAGAGGHKEINRTNIPVEDIAGLLQKDLVKKQLELLRFRNTCPVFSDDSQVTFHTMGNILSINWENDYGSALLEADFATEQYRIIYRGHAEKPTS